MITLLNMIQFINAVGLEEPKVEEIKFGICGPGTKLINGICIIIDRPSVKPWWQF